MKKFNFKSMVIGLLIGIIIVLTIFVVREKKSTIDSNTKVDTVHESEEIKSAKKEKIQKGMEITTDSLNNETDAEAIETIKKTGNWNYIENYIPNMTNNGIEKVVEIYNSKHTNLSEYKKASDYIKK